MESYTTNLNLLKKDPVADASDTFNITTMLNENWDKIDAAMGAARAAEPYSAAKTYAVGDYCTRDGALFKCTVAITAPETWTAGHWKATSVAAELLAIIASLSSKMPLNGGTFYGRVNWFDENRSIGNGATPNQLDIVCGRASIRFDPDNIASGLSQCVLLRDTGSGTAYAIATATPPTEYDLPLASGWSGTLKYFKTQENVCIVTGTLTKDSQFSTFEVFGTLPAGYKPATSASYPAAAFASHTSLSITAADNGQLSLGDVGGLTTQRVLFFNISFVAGN